MSSRRRVNGFACNARILCRLSSRENNTPGLVFIAVPFLLLGLQLLHEEKSGFLKPPIVICTGMSKWNSQDKIAVWVPKIQEKSSST